jgi:hypothetical protein
MLAIALREVTYPHGLDSLTFCPIRPDRFILPLLIASRVFSFAVPRNK